MSRYIPDPANSFNWKASVSGGRRVITREEDLWPQPEDTGIAEKEALRGIAKRNSKRPRLANMERAIVEYLKADGCVTRKSVALRHGVDRVTLGRHLAHISAEEAERLIEKYETKECHR